MAYGEDGATIDDTPRQLRRPLREQKPEPEVDRFDEGTYLCGASNVGKQRQMLYQSMLVRLAKF